uniref:hypothetical protein n=1 Tax=Herbidospora sakaeratensis TaxID=564415 RepID=UPI0007849B08|nr:hypothetical protein [Herbidospora sakaeratensis]
MVTPIALNASIFEGDVTILDEQHPQHEDDERDPQDGQPHPTHDEGDARVIALARRVDDGDREPPTHPPDVRPPATTTNHERGPRSSAGPSGNRHRFCSAPY